MTTLSIVNAIISVGNGLISTMSGSAAGNNNNLKKSLETLKDTLLPEDVTQKKKRDRRIIDVLTAEAAQGPLMVRKMSSGSSRDKGRIKRRRRSDTDGPEQPKS